MTGSILTLAFVLAGEPVRFNENQFPMFTDRQVRGSAAATREGLERWAGTAQGKRIIERFDHRDYRIVIVEDYDENGMGRAPQPAMGTMTAANDRTKLKTYTLILNPAFFELPRDFRPLTRPVDAAGAMAAAWAAEMLHIYFYSQGISLPHHERPDFQREWRAVAEELGFPELQHPGARAARGW